MNEQCIEVYFDYRSPYAYLATEPVYALAARCQAELVWKPIRLPALSSYRERPLNSSYPKKMAYLAKDVQRWAIRLGVSCRFPRALRSEPEQSGNVVFGKDHPLDTDRALRGALVAQARGVFNAYHRAVFAALWAEGKNIGHPDVLAAIITQIGHDPAAFGPLLDSESIHAQLETLTREADERGVFGVPTFFVGQEMFWGNDRLDFVEQELHKR